MEARKTVSPHTPINPQQPAKCADIDIKATHSHTLTHTLSHTHTHEDLCERVLQARRPQRQGYCRQFIASSDKTRTHSSHFGSLIESSTRKEALVPALVCYVHFPWRWAWGRRACSTFKFPQTLTCCEKPSQVVWLADCGARARLYLNSLSVESL